MTDLQKELAELRDEFNTKKVQWENEKKSVEKVQKLREEIEQVKNEIKTAQQNYDLEKAAELQYGKNFHSCRNSWEVEGKRKLRIKIFRWVQ